jgi:hypothetical protein
MVNLFLEIQKLKAILSSKGLDEEVINGIVEKAELEISNALKEKLNEALDRAVESGVQKDSADFINDLRPRPDAFIIDTGSGKTDFTEPPFPMLDRLLANGAKPMKDRSGVYKVIPVGAKNKPKNPIHTNIVDAQKAIMAQRHEEHANMYKNMAPKGSKVEFRTASSKQDRNSNWVMPEKIKNFTEELNDINSSLEISRDQIILDIIRSYEDGF